MGVGAGKACEGEKRTSEKRRKGVPAMEKMNNEEPRAKREEREKTEQKGGDGLHLLVGITGMGLTGVVCVALLTKC